MVVVGLAVDPNKITFCMVGARAPDVSVSLVGYLVGSLVASLIGS